jgi:cell division protein FtsQ
MTPALRRSLKVATWMLALAMVALPVVAVVNGWIGSERWPLRTLRVNDGLERVDQARLRETLLPYAQRGFFAVPLADARMAVERLPWVERVEVRKRWPDVLEVRIDEHRPFARWGEDRLLSEQGRLFPVAGIDLPAGLPLLHGPDARTEDVVALYNESRALFAASGFDVRGVVLDPRGSWSLQLGNGTDVIVGSQEARLRLRRFARMQPHLLARNPQPLQRADLRYTNGFALTWGEKQDAAQRAPGGEAELVAWQGHAVRAFTNHESRITNHGSPT